MKEIDDVPTDPQKAAALIVAKMIDFMDVTAEEEKISHLNLIVHFMLNVHVENYLNKIMSEME